MIEAKQIYKRYGNLEVLKGIDVSIAPGTLTALLGRSGSGKSTLLHILGTLDQADSGEVIINGQATKLLKGKALHLFRNQSVGFVFQFHHLLPEFSAIENVMIPALIGGQKEQLAREEAGKLLDYLGLASRSDHKPAQLSGGEQQRVAVARALVNKPAVVLADEPTGNLDETNAAEMHQLFLKLKDDFGHTFLLATHSRELASICDTQYHLVDGRIQV
jgi:lipoprotein-releasing system ATP-binding protein